MGGQSQEASLKPLMMTHHLRRDAARKMFCQKDFPHDTYLRMISASRGIILSHIWCGTSGTSPPNLPCQPVGGPRHGIPEGGGGPGKGLEPPPPPVQANFPPALSAECVRFRVGVDCMNAVDVCCGGGCSITGGEGGGQM